MILLKPFLRLDIHTRQKVRNMEKEEMNAESKDQTKSGYHDHMHYHGDYHFRPFKLAFMVIFGVIAIGILVSIAGIAHRRAMVYNSGYAKPMMRHGGGLGERGMGRGKMGGHMRSNTVIGAVTKVDGANLTVKDAGTDVVVTIADTTQIYKNNAVASKSDITVGSTVIVQGLPNSSGAIQASVITIH